MSFDADEFARVYRREAGRCIATMVGVLGDIDAAEDAVADAFSVAARRWPTDGFPPNPGAWITTTARNRAIDRRRRESRGSELVREAHRLEKGDPTMPAHLGDLDVVDDDQLRLIFLCCHPALSADARVALTLRLLGGLDTPEIARAFLVPEATMAQRIVRAKRKIRDSHVTYRVPTADDLPERLASVLAAIYLIFNEGHTASVGPDLTRFALIDEAIRLSRLVVDLLPDAPEAQGLLALMLLTEARRPARVSADGDLVRLADQDRSLWDHALIVEGHDLVRACLRRGEPGQYQFQAAIAAVHADAPTADATDWTQIVALYDQLLVARPDDIVRLNRAVAVAQVDGPQAGLDSLNGLDLDDYHLFHAIRAEFLEALGHTDDSLDAIERALSLTSNETERRHLLSLRAGTRRGGV